MSYDAFVAQRSFPVTPSNTLQLTDPVDGSVRTGVIECKGAAGNVDIIDASGNARTYPLAVGEMTKCIVSQVKTSSTATVLWCHSKY